MSLPGITAPPGTPPFLSDGHANQDDPLFAQVRTATGHSRARRVRTVPERVADVSWFLDAAELAAIDTWYWDTLQCGALEFAAHVRNRGPGMLWYRARWISFETEMLTLQRGRLRGQLLLMGDGEVNPPDTSALRSEVTAALLSLSGTAILIPKVLDSEVTVALLTLSGEIGAASLAMEGSVGLAGDLNIVVNVDISAGAAALSGALSISGDLTITP